MTFSRYIALMLTLLIGVTWRLWFDTDGPIPAVPCVHFELPPQNAIGPAVFVAILAAWTNRRSGWIVAASALTFCFIVDQATLQPWAYQIAIYAALFAAAPHTLRYHRAIAISLYLYSGLGKLDYQFAHTVGFDFLQTMTFGLVQHRTPLTTAAVLMLPIVETTAAIGLCLAKTRRIAAAIILVLHASLIAILGPWSLDHSWGVLVWNGLLMGQTYLLFLRTDRTPAPVTPVAMPLPAILLTAVVILGPLGERFGYWDHWLAWQLYAPHTSRVDAQVSATSVSKLGALEYFVDDDPDGDRWHSLDLSTASLNLRGVPLYPQARYQRELLRCIARKRGLGRGVRGVEKGPADRWTGRRREEYFVAE